MQKDWAWLKLVQLGGRMSLPFFEQQVNQNVYLRKFLNDTEDEEYVWHRDQEDRVIEVISSDGWQFQQENELPVDRKSTRLNSSH